MPRNVRLLLFVLAVVPVVTCFVYVDKYGVNVPVEDDWSTVALIVDAASGDVTLSDLFGQHNEHRILVPRLVMLGLAKATHYDVVTEMYLIAGSLLLTAATVFLALRRTVAARALLLLPIPVALITSPRQWETLLLGFNIVLAFAVAFGVLALLLLLTSGRRFVAIAAFAGALVAATIASYSAVQGLMVWPAGVVQLLLSRRPNRTLLIAVWVATGLSESVLYFHGYSRPAGSPSPSHAFEHPLEGLEYFVTLLGGSLFSAREAAFAAGLFLLAAFLAAIASLWKRGNGQAAAFWLSLLAFSVGILFAITIGRVGFGVEQSLSSRYASYSLLAVVAILLLHAGLAFEGSSRTHLVFTVALTALIAVSLFSAYAEGGTKGGQVRFGRKLAAFYLATYQTQPDANLRAVYRPSATAVRALAPTLERMRYTVFARRELGQLPPEIRAVAADRALSTCIVDSIDGKPVTLDESRTGFLDLRRGIRLLDARGWCVDERAKRPAGGAYLLLDGNPYPVHYGSSRPDVAAYFAVDDYVYSGFTRALRIPPLERGNHRLSMVAISSDRKRSYRPSPKLTLRVR